MPRETVWRKVGILLERGWIARDEKGYLSVTRQAAQDLKAGSDASITYLAALLSVLRSR